MLLASAYFIPTLATSGCVQSTIEQLTTSKKLFDTFLFVQQIWKKEDGAVLDGRRDNCEHRHDILQVVHDFHDPQSTPVVLQLRRSSVYPSSLYVNSEYSFL